MTSPRRALAVVLAAVLALVAVVPAPARAADSSDRRLSRIAIVRHKALHPKSLGISPGGLVFAQNMTHKHNVTVLDLAGNVLKVIPDTVDLAAFGVPGRTGLYRGSPVEVVFSLDGRYAYVSNYRMSGKGYRRPGHEHCTPGRWDESFVYRIDLATLEIDQVIPTGAVAKFLTITPDGTRLLVSNWCSYDVSVIDLATTQTVARVNVGKWPRGLVVTADSTTAYVAVMGANKLGRIDLGTFTFEVLPYKGRTPRHLVLSPDEQYLYVSYNLDSRLRRIHLASGQVTTLYTGNQPRSMVLAEDGASLFVVNYRSGTLTKVRLSDFTVVQRIKTGGTLPVGVTYDASNHRVWVANYTGTISIFQDA